MAEPQITVDQLAAMRGTPVYDSNGEKIGAVEEIYYDERTSEPQWIGIGTGFLGLSHAVVRWLAPPRRLTVSPSATPRIR